MHVKTIPAWASFSDVLAQWLLEAPGDLSSSLILLPNRRACRVLREALIFHAEGRPMLLPRMMPFADLDPEDAILSPQWIGGDVMPPISSTSRQGILMQMIIKYGQAIGESGYGQAGHAYQLAGELSRLLDQIHWEGLHFDDLQGLVPEDYAKHWQITLDFLKIITEHWPQILLEKGLSDPAAWRRDLILGYAEKWRHSPPVYPVIAAGSTGSIPCTATLMKVVADLPQGLVVLPGLDCQMPDEEWDQLEITHPQYGMAQLLSSFGLDRKNVDRLGSHKNDPGEARFKVLSRAMQPSVGGKWQIDPDVAHQACRDFHVIECANSHQEAGIIALMMRQVLEESHQTVALVTPDRGLVARVHRELERWNLKADDTAGSSLSEIPIATFMLLLAESLLDRESILSFLKVMHHPLLCDKDFVRELDREECRLYRTISSMVKGSERFSAFYQQVAQASDDFIQLTRLSTVALQDLMAAHIKVAAFFLSEEGLVSGSYAQAFVDFWQNLMESASSYPYICARDYPALLRQMMSSVTVREPYGYHPRLFILGPLEARTVKTDVMILSGLNEGAWPALMESDPWLNRPMRSSYGLPLPERRIGLSAHDFAQAFCAKKVMCTRALRVNGVPTVASRWLMRLETVLRASGVPLIKTAEPWLTWYQGLDKPERMQRTGRPAPCPPLSARPTQLSVTQVETWMRDPYVLYARQILKLRELGELEYPMRVADKGTLIHGILENYIQGEARDVKVLLAIGRQAFDAYGDQPEIVNFWWPRFERIAEWFVTHETTRSSEILKSYTEISGRYVFPTSIGSFTLTAKADRIDVRRDGSVDVIDYKTGGVPTKQEIEQGLSPQLTLEASILSAGGFKEVGERAVHSAQYWQLRGSHPAGETRVMDLLENSLQKEAMAGLKSLVEVYANPDVPYLAQPRPKHALKYNPYAHLTRSQEWSRS
ncbi:MAG: PD-(D/E)XK nuclease family protein [Alphaproteobacteria bacterium]|nr:PD-(D/E)XK nuclease family protein [Alphaproteobacteria bacterium]